VQELRSHFFVDPERLLDPSTFLEMHRVFFLMPNLLASAAVMDSIRLLIASESVLCRTGLVHRSPSQLVNQECSMPTAVLFEIRVEVSRQKWIRKVREVRREVDDKGIHLAQLRVAMTSPPYDP